MQRWFVSPCMFFCRFCVCFLALAIGSYMFSSAHHRLHVFSSALGIGYIFPALASGYTFSRGCYRSLFSRSYHRMIAFPCLPFVICFAWLQVLLANKLCWFGMWCLSFWFCSSYFKLRKPFNNLIDCCGVRKHYCFEQSSCVLWQFR